MRLALPPVSLLFGMLLSAQTNEARVDLVVTINKSIVVENEAGVKRISTANGDVAEAVAVSAKEILINGKAPGETSVVLWDASGARKIYDVHVLANQNKVDAARKQLAEELPGQPISLAAEDGYVLLRGVAKDPASGDRAVAIASVLGKVSNLLRLETPAAEPQILLHVRFANVDRSATSELAFNLLSTGATNTIGAISTGQFPAPLLQSANPGNFSLSDALNIFLYRKDINLGAVIEALEAKQLVQILAEPNLMTVSGKAASFLAGGEFPFPTLQGGGAGVGQITIQFKEFGVRVNFVPTVTPRGTIRLLVTPEVSSLDIANGLTVQGITVPGLATRRIQTEVELGNGQSFVIAGLMDNRLTETINRIPGLASIPLLGKLFQSRISTKNNSELLVMVTPEIVDPAVMGSEPSNLKFPKEFLPVPPLRPAVAKTGGQTMTSGEIALCIRPGELRDETRRALGDLQIHPAFELDEPSAIEQSIAALIDKQANVLLLGLETVHEQLGSLLPNLRASIPHLKIVGLHHSPDPQIILAAMRAGAAEFLHPPLSGSMRAALERLAASPEQLDARPKQGEVIGFLSSKGGCGATTLACHVAAELRRQTKRDTLLADFDFTSGMIGFLMKTPGEYSIIDAVQNLYRLDASIWKGLVGRSKLDLAIMPTPSALAQDLRLDEGDIQRVLRFMRTQHDWVVVDLGRSLTRLTRAAIEELDHLFLVSTLEVPALYGVKNIIRQLTESAGDIRKLEVVLNRAPASMDVSVKELETTLGRHIYATLPNDYASLYQSYADGSLLQGNNRLALHFARFASKLAGIEAKKTKKKFSLFG